MSESLKKSIFTFVDTQGTFRVRNPHSISYLYFPLVNSQGTLLSSISPNLAGEIKRGQESFLTPPVSIEDIHHSYLCRRDFFLRIISPKTNKPFIRLSEYPHGYLEAGILYHKLTTKYRSFNAEILTFIPHNLAVEVSVITVFNRSSEILKYIPTSFMPLFGRDAERLRDHRHVSSLLNRITLTKYGIILKPTMIFQESGHKKNTTCYFSFGYQENAIAPIGQFPTLLSFTGEGGSLAAPAAIVHNLDPIQKKECIHEGKENCAALRFPFAQLHPGQKITYVLLSGITDSNTAATHIFTQLNTLKKVYTAFKKTRLFWNSYLNRCHLDFDDHSFTPWLRWVSLQPTLRKLFGCSFLPHFDYGKGGRGWRDLWQDALHLLTVEPKKTKTMLIKNFCGVRIDGSNATIITRENKFIADRNQITRVWMDHGIWPYLTLNEYINRTGDIEILLHKTTYFRDFQLKRARARDTAFRQKKPVLLTSHGIPYQGTILEHILIELLTQFYNVGTHNIIRLENADWNDGLDMAPKKGESAAFTCMYAHHLHSLCHLLTELKDKVKSVSLLQEMFLLLNPQPDTSCYTNPRKKQEILETFLELTQHTVSGKMTRISLDSLITALSVKAQWLSHYLRTQEWLPEKFYNGYYDETGTRVEGKTGRNVRMLLASQVFAIMSGVATEEQIPLLYHSIKKYLWDTKLGGFRLNTNFCSLYLTLGRAFGFSYGDKENGSFFNHMIILFAYALYSRGFSREGAEVLGSIFHMALSPHAKIYPMIPEYFNNEGRGLYFYLTGSASWYLHTLLQQMLGIQGVKGNLLIKPRLFPFNFPGRFITVSLSFGGKRLQIVYSTLTKTGSPYSIGQGFLNATPLTVCDNEILIEKTTLHQLAPHKVHTIKVVLQ